MASRPAAKSQQHRPARTESALGTTELNERSYDGSMRRREPPAMGRTLPTLKRAWPKDGPLAAICVQSVDVQCVLQFTLIHAAGCVLHRRTSRVIHRLKLFSFLLHEEPDDEGSRRLSLRFTTNVFCEKKVTKNSQGGREPLRTASCLNRRWLSLSTGNESHPLSACGARLASASLRTHAEPNSP